MNDANASSLLSLAILGCVLRDDALRRQTETRCCSEANPYFFRGRAGGGIGGPHVALVMIWPIPLIARAMGSDDDATIYRCLDILKARTRAPASCTRRLPRTIHPTSTRPWFAWANSLFGELIADLVHGRPALFV